MRSILELAQEVMPMTCSICNHPKRAEIERACLLRNFGSTDVTLADIAIEYKLDLKELQVHVLTHIPLEEANRDNKEQSISIASEIKRREADILRQVMEDHYITFKNIGDKINNIVAVHTIDAPAMQQITKPLADLYLGTSQAIRDTSDKLLKMNIAVNGAKDEGVQSLVNLVAAIKES